MDQRFAVPNFLQPNLHYAAPPSSFATGDVSGQTAAALSTLLALLQPFSAGMTVPATATPPIATPDVDRRASEALLRDITGAAMRKLLDYLEQAGDKHSEIARCYRPLHAAIQAYRSRDYAGALDIIYQLYRTIEAARARHPDLPEMGKSAPTGGKHAPA